MVLLPRILHIPSGTDMVTVWWQVLICIIIHLPFGEEPKSSPNCCFFKLCNVSSVFSYYDGWPLRQTSRDTEATPGHGLTIIVGYWSCGAKEAMKISQLVSILC